MKMMFRFPGSRKQYDAVVGDTVYFDSAGLFALSRRQFLVNEDIHYDLGYSYGFGNVTSPYVDQTITGRAFIDTKKDCGAQMREVQNHLESIFGRPVQGFSCNIADTWYESVDHQLNSGKKKVA